MHGHLASSPVYPSSFTLEADPQIPPLTARLLQTRRFCSGYDTACLTFSTASSLGKLRNCCTGFCWRKWLPTKRSNDLSPNKIWHLASVNGKLHITGRVEELCFSVQVRSQIYATSDADTKYSSLLLFFFLIFISFLNNHLHRGNNKKKKTSRQTLK